MTPFSSIKKYQVCEEAEGERHRLILEHLPQVRLIARRIRERLPDNVNLDDLVSAGTVGLIAAVDRFDPSRNIKLKTYAEHKIRGAILDFLRRLDWAPREVRRLGRQIEATIAILERRVRRAPTEDEIAQELNLSLGEYHKCLMNLRGVNLWSIDASYDTDDGRNLLRYFPCGDEKGPSYLVERSELQRLLAEAIEKIPRIEKIIINLYYHEELTLREISKVMNVHESRVSQLRAQALLRLRNYLKNVRSLERDAS